ncbi:MAG: hypothetical protein VB119_09740, partial [Candidatus Metalachnospira sp.]|nr:hypothetical protein [Candidatus Metalachnospira sp.]
HNLFVIWMYDFISVLKFDLPLCFMFGVLISNYQISFNGCPILGVPIRRVTFLQQSGCATGVGCHAHKWRFQKGN